ncbi:unnamed protein product [Ilex paraguariensis]|uniref:Uncharacterized protein n=1 Tax=Ilex paraguariensis TaxID=185542 RepID=A0ABC8T5P5_9AQUA
MAVLTNGSSLRPPLQTCQSSRPRHLNHSNIIIVRRRAFSQDSKGTNLPQFFKSSSLLVKSFQGEDAENYEAAISRNTPEGQNKVTDKVFENLENKTAGTESSFLAKLAIVLGIAATITLVSIGLKQPNQGRLLGFPYLADASSSSTLAAPAVGFTFKAFGYRVVLPEFAPGWIYFWLLMAAGCGLFISEEALNIWVCPLYWYFCFTDFRTLTSLELGFLFFLQHVIF